ncbi:SUN domain-containing protein 1-like isoform X2 [Paralichthys olivaceus]|uniref:SUN domain-containing protein 1-like isoform X2 n=1 Tax=Paralichthys olivaceus TaxID=8255 RepID=UPI00374FE65D
MKSTNCPHCHPVMSRRSSRLLSSGYYNTESDSSSVRTIFYGANPIKVIKRRTETCSCTSGRTTGNASSPNHEPPLTAGNFSEEFYRKPMAAPNFDPRSEYRSRISSAFFGLIGLSTITATMKSKVIHLSALAKYSLKSIKRKAFVLCFLSLLVFQCFIFLHQSDIIHDAAEQLQKLSSSLEALDPNQSVLQILITELEQAVLLERIKELSSNQNMPDANMKYVLHMLIPKLQQEMEKCLTDLIKEHDTLSLADEGKANDSGHPIPDKMTDFALKSRGAKVISARCSEPYRSPESCASLFGFCLLCSSDNPSTDIQGTLTIALSHHTKISHVTLDQLPRNNSPKGCMDTAPKDFEVYAMKDASDSGTLLGIFTFDENGESTQTFKLPTPTDEFYNIVALHVLSNCGQPEYKCLYGFRVHGEESSSDDNRGAFKFAFPRLSVGFDIINSTRMSITFTLHFTPKYAVCLTFLIHPLTLIPSIEIHFKFNIM